MVTYITNGIQHYFHFLFYSIFAGLYLKKLKVYHDTKNFHARYPAVTIGIFDGVHKGHLQIINRLKEIVSETGGETVVVTLWPHPRIVLSKQKVDLLSTLSEKISLIEKYGIDHLIILPFTKDFSNTPFNEFIEQYFVHDIGAEHIVIGYNHHFGKDRKGGFEQLQKSAKELNFKVERLNPVMVNDKMVSSSAIRELIQKGEIDVANGMLEYRYTIKGRVVEGKKLGRKIGFPTANIVPVDPMKLIPLNGVYAVKVNIDGEIFSGMLNIGFRPTIQQQYHSLTIEVNIFDFEKDIYEKEISVVFVKRIRDEKKFVGIEELTNQLEIDKIETINILKDKNV